MNEFTHIIEKPNGAKFYWADLHIHTPKWHGFKLPKGINLTDENSKRKFAKEYIKRAQETCINLIGITEHNDASWVDYIREAAKDSNIVVFPGFEITTQSGADGIHVICLFNPDTPKDILDGLLSNFGLLPGSRFNPDGSPKAVNKDFKTIIESVKQQGGICIAAHMSSNNGLLCKVEGQIRRDLFTNPDLLAGEIPSGREELGNFEKKVVSNEMDAYKRKFPIACINSSDAKSIEEIGKKKTFIKISSFTVEGLREAFLDWQSRIRLINEIPQELPRFSKIIGAKWEGGFLKNVDIHFNDNLNCIIGGKGTGKSTIIETLRYVFDQQPKAEKIEEQHKEILKEVFRSGSRITVFIESHQPFPRKYLIERTYPNPPVVKDEDGNVISDLRPRDIIQVEIFGQKEIYEISKDRQFQFALLDRFIGNKLDLLNQQNSTIFINLEQNKSNILQKLKRIRSYSEDISLIPSLEEQIKAYKSIGLDEKIKEKRLYSEEKRLINKGLEKLRNFKLCIDNFEKGLDLDASFLLQAHDELPNKELLKKAGKIIEEFSKKVKEYTTNMKENLGKVIEMYSGDQSILKEWEKLNEEQNQRYTESLRFLQEKYPNIDPEDFLNLENKLAELKEMEEERKKDEVLLRNLEDERKALLIKLNENRSKIFRLRQEVMDELNQKLDGRIRIRLEFQGEKQEFIKRIKELKSGVKEEQINQIVKNDDFSPMEFANLVREGPNSLIKKYKISQSSAQSLYKAIMERNEEIYDLEIFEIPTKPVIELNLGTKESPNFRNIDNLSVGQKCTALLTLILLENPYPLIIDQPEDDLDNSFIVNDIVNKLRKEKEHRQFIIATHNANIPVLGDAEFIIPLQASANQGEIDGSRCGSIDDELVKEVVKNTLEGGKEAFEIRRQKYGI